ncbi:MAG: DUF6231 family protein [Oleiphilaceae bacterium]|nr:DUF6231 family protein [Oleiphilaceae bacterium]
MPATHLSVLQVLQHLIEQNQLHRALYLGEHAPPLAVTNFTLLPHTLGKPDARTEFTPHIAALPECDLIIVGDVMDKLDHTQGLHLLAGLRNHLQGRICLLAPHPSKWSFTDLIGLGFKRLAECTKDGHQVMVYSYAISDYNFTREWNNARFWANPEMFGKYWW